MILKINLSIIMNDLYLILAFMVKLCYLLILIKKINMNSIYGYLFSMSLVVKLFSITFQFGVN